jgi:electron transport complex protein RnfG
MKERQTKEQRGFLGMLKLGLVLALFAAAACVLLAFVYAGTQKIIEGRQQADLEASLLELFPGADSFDPVSGIASPDPAVTVESAYAAIKNGEIIGLGLQVITREGYGGPIKALAGISVEGTITRVKIMEHSETPGLGANAGAPSYYVDREKKITFYGQFAGKSVTDPFEAKGDVQAITASTVTSNAIARAVKAAGGAASAWLFGIEKFAHNADGSDTANGISTGEAE